MNALPNALGTILQIFEGVESVANADPQSGVVVLDRRSARDVESAAAFVTLKESCSPTTKAENVRHKLEDESFNVGSAVFFPCSGAPSTQSTQNLLATYLQSAAILENQLNAVTSAIKGGVMVFSEAQGAPVKNSTTSTIIAACTAATSAYDVHQEAKDAYVSAREGEIKSAHSDLIAASRGAPRYRTEMPGSSGIG